MDIAGRAIGFCDLPIELKTNIFKFLRAVKDQKSVCFVSREWKDIMAPILWESFKTDLQPSSSKTLDALLHPKSGILPHVRKLSLYRRRQRALDRGTKFHLRQLLIALPRDRLLCFQSNLDIDEEVILDLFQTQRQLKRLGTNFASTSTRSPQSQSEGKRIKDCPWIIPCFEHLKSLSTCVSVFPEQAAEAYESFLIILRNSPKLEDLTIELDPGWSKHPVNVATVLPPSTERLNLSNLTSLGFTNLDFSEQGLILLEHIKFVDLVKLRIFDCDYLRPFLRGLSRLFSNAKPALKKLEVVLEGSSRKTTQAIENLLLSFEGLRELWLDVETDADRYFRKEAIMQHGSSLDLLGLGAEKGKSPPFSVQDVILILNACPRLSQLAMNLPSGFLGPCYYGFLLGTRTFLAAEKDFKTLITAIAAHPNIRILRMLDCPDIDYFLDQSPSLSAPNSIKGGHFTAAQACMQNIATQVMRKLVHGNSKIKFLVLSPYHLLRYVAPIADSNNHTWPDYAYSRGRTNNSRGRKWVVAAPLPQYLAELGGEYPIVHYHEKTNFL